MKKILLATVATGLLAAGAASAADLPRRTAPAPVAPIVAVPLFTWTGFYVGVNAGYGFSNRGDENAFAPAGTFAAAGPAFAGTNGTFFSGNGGDNNGFTGGAQAGYNFQFGLFVAGIEADIQYLDLNRGNNNGFATFVGAGPLPPGFVYNGGVASLDYFGTVRGRLGVAFDRTLVYATGGFAYGGGDDGNAIYGGGNSTRGGYAVGGGVEYAFTNNLTAKLEGLYVNLDRNRNNGFIGTDGAGRIYSVADGRNRDNDFGVVRAGLNFKFNSF